VPKRGKDRGLALFNAIVLLVVLPIVLVAGLYWFLNHEPARIDLKYGELVQMLRAPDPGVRFRNVKIDHNFIYGEIVTSDPVSAGEDKAGVHEETKLFRSQRVALDGDTPHIVQLLTQRGILFDGGQEESPWKGFYSLVISFVFIFLIVGLVFLMIRWLSGGSSPLTFGRSRHKVYAERDVQITFQDAAGIDEAVAELREIVDFLKTPGKYQTLGGRIPKGVLLVGPPGTGKTLLAKAVAGEAHVAFFSMSGSDFVEMFVGVGASRVRDLFAQAEARAPCIIFIDELDALGKTRGGSAIGGHDEREQTLNQLLVEMDGFDSNRGVIIMAATNRPETLDAALLRPGRFDRTVVVDRPDIAGREAILKVHARHVKLADDVDLRHVAALTPGSVGADLANLINEAALIAARRNKDRVSMAELDEAIERGTVGLERKSRIMHADEKQRVAYHEGGHALVTCALPNTHAVHKVSIIPRGVGALGYVLRRPEEDRYLLTRSELESHIKVALGGTVAEEIVYHEISNGATSDLEKANEYARRMVKEFGMSRLGRIYYRDQGGSQFLGGSGGDGDSHYSEETAREIDLEVRRIVDEATAEVRSILLARRAALEALAQRLIEKEVIDAVELRTLLDQHYPGPNLVPGSQAVEAGPGDEAAIKAAKQTHG
jgi:cell division protease FtsH